VREPIRQEFDDVPGLDTDVVGDLLSATEPGHGDEGVPARPHGGEEALRSDRPGDLVVPDLVPE
jgi:hypothetical protein